MKLHVGLLMASTLLLSPSLRGQNTSMGIFRSLYAAQENTLDTNPTSDFWKEASPVFAESDEYGHVLPKYRTEVRSRWTKKNLYVLFICPYEELYLKPLPRQDIETNELWNWDVAELFIGSDFKNIFLYKEFEISPQGEWIDLNIDLRLPHHEVGWTWNSGFTVRARIDAKTRIWYGAMRIPFAAIDTRPAAVGNLFRANLFRSQGPPGRQKSIAWKAPMSGTFHTPERFGELQLVDR